MSAGEARHKIEQGRRHGFGERAWQAWLILGGLAASHFLSTSLARPVEQLAVDSAHNLVQRERAEAASAAAIALPMRPSLPIMPMLVMACPILLSCASWARWTTSARG